MNHMLGVLIESLVAVLLMVTIGYCMLLNKRLTRLKADEQSLKAVIAELVTATEIAERAIAGLKLTVRDCNENLGSRIDAATEMSGELSRRLLAGDELLRRLSRIVAAGRGAEDAERAPERTTAHSPQAIVAAAKAFSERKRTPGIAA
ncbi:MAG: DUF6468 domain-containing protein [Xanthobacteraceae bacterium]|nr:DUF6468 domain-containing protein [Xanthobacteraceae bacterium]